MHGIITDVAHMLEAPLAEVLGNHGAISAATMTNAELLRCENDLGQVKSGFKADLIVVDGNPLDDIGRLENDGAHIPLVMRDGQIFKNELASA